MTVKLRQIEVEAATADALEARAAELGISVAELLVDLVDESLPSTADTEQIAELDRRWAEVVAGEPTVTNDEVVRWLETWGTPAYKPWSGR
jgi:predicted transcriptional regulator